MKLSAVLKLACLVSLVAAADARMVQAHKRQLAKRQSISISDTDPDASIATTPTASAPAQTTDDTNTSDGGLLGGILDPDASQSTTRGQASVPNPLIPPVQTSTSSSATSSSSSASSSSSSSSRSTPRNAADTSTINITSTQSSDSTAAAQNNKDEDEGSGIGKKTLIIVISVASAVGLVAAVWTILRKWKFSPSRKFEERLNPIDWDPHTGEKEKLERTPSINSALTRQNSWGSGSNRGAAMTEVAGYARPPPSVASTGGFNGVAPGYPPSYSSRGYVPEMPQQYGSQHSLNNPYEYSNVTRQGSQVNGGRYGEGYNH